MLQFYEWYIHVLQLSYPSIHHVFVCTFWFCYILCSTHSEDCKHYELVERMESHFQQEFYAYHVGKQATETIKTILFLHVSLCYRRRRHFQLFSILFSAAPLGLLNAMSANEFKTFSVLTHFGTKRTDYRK